jgi:hypothetical protein
MLAKTIFEARGAAITVQPASQPGKNNKNHIII